MKKYIFILGHLPILSIAEVLSLFNNRANIIASDKDFLIVESDQKIDVSYDNIGGVRKIGEMKEISDKSDILEKIDVVVGDFCKEKGITKKLEYSVSMYGKNRKLQGKILTNIKKGSSRYILGKRRFLNKNFFENPSDIFIKSENVLNDGFDLICCEKNDKFYIGFTDWIQNVDDYSKRDLEKPFRDSKNGMLPPKLSQTMINLSNISKKDILWDPFCGSGSLLFEALLRGVDVFGSDFNQTMVEHTLKNLDWFSKQYDIKNKYEILNLDVTKIRTLPDYDNLYPNIIVTEGYLGKNFTDISPTRQSAMEEQKFILEMWKKFFDILLSTNKKFTLVITLPIHILSTGEFIRSKALFSIIRKKKINLVPLINSEFLQSIDKYIKKSYTSEGTILYTRGSKFIGREIIKLEIN